MNLLIPGPVEGLETRSEYSSLDMPRADELVSSVRDHLRGEIMAASHGRQNFLARVAANSLDIVLRELQAGAAAHQRERERLCALLDADDALEPLRWRLVEALRDGSLPLERAGLAEILRETVVNQIAIDQPKYSGYRQASGKGE